MTSPHWHAFSLEDIRAVQVIGDQDDIKDEHVNWFVSYSEEAEPGGGGHVVVATLHAAFSGGRVDATVGGRLIPVSSAVEVADVKEAIATSAALESLYDFARTIAKSVLGTLDISGALPYKSPSPELAVFGEPEGEIENGEAALEVNAG